MIDCVPFIFSGDRCEQFREEEEVESDEDFIYIVGILILMELKNSRDK